MSKAKSVNSQLTQGSSGPLDFNHSPILIRVFGSHGIFIVIYQPELVVAADLMSSKVVA